MAIADDIPEGDIYHPPGGLAHIRNSIIWSIIPELLFFIIVATVVCVVSEFTSHPLQIASTVLTVFGTALSFIVGFRTTSAMDKYGEGRKLWGQIQLASRTFSRIAWIHVPNRVTSGPADDKDVDHEELRCLIEKRSMITLCSAFNVATKHYLRGESGPFYKDLYPLICWLPKYSLPSGTYFSRSDLPEERTYTKEPDSSASPFRDDPNVHVELLSREMSPQLSTATSATGNSISSSYGKKTMRSATTATWKSVETVTNRRGLGASAGSGATASESFPRRVVPPQPLLPSRNPPPSRLDDFIPWYTFFHDAFVFLFRRAKKVSNRVAGRKKKRKPIVHDEQNDNIPLEITILLSGWVNAVQSRGHAPVPTINSLLAAVQTMSEALTGLERVLLTPIPQAYSLHLRHAIWIYLFLLPSQIHATFGWKTIPATAIVAFVFLGFIQIGQEIESPFGYDDADLELDTFCRTIIRELNELTAHPPRESAPENFCFVDTNLPLAQPPLYEGYSATQMVDEGMEPADFLAGLRAATKHAIGAELRSEQSLRGKGEMV
ncbi:UPF0187-domain-containing protein [Meredithblackwellia eburnea MCA 4105]